MRWAIISDDELYRYELGRKWDLLKPAAVWIMLNPSTADGKQDDATIRRVIGFSKGLGYGGAVVVNLFAYRARNPRHLYEPVVEPIGPENDQAIRLVCDVSNRPIIAAWGGHRIAVERARYVLEELLPGREIKCLGVNGDGSPKHPLYLRSSSKLINYRRPE